MNKISLVGYVAGIVTIILAIQRWWFVYYDPSQMLNGIGFGMLALAGAYILNWMKCSIEDSNKEKMEIDKKFKDIDEQILTWNAWNAKQKTKEEFE